MTAVTSVHLIEHNAVANRFWILCMTRHCKSHRRFGIFILTVILNSPLPVRLNGTILRCLPFIMSSFPLTLLCNLQVIWLLILIGLSTNERSIYIMDHQISIPSVILVSNVSESSNRTMYVSKDDISEGETYMFSVLMTVTIGENIYQTRSGYMRIVNYLPYGGTCHISQFSGS